jgi:hypothetical protein
MHGEQRNSENRPREGRTVSKKPYSAGSANPSIYQSNTFDKYSQAISTSEFLQSLFGDLPEDCPYFHTWKLQGRVTGWCNSVEAASAFVDQHADADLYVGIAITSHKGTRHTRITSTSAGGIVALVADIDIAGDGHGDKRYPPTLEAALALLGDIPLPPSYIINSGGGAHAWWLLREPWVFDNDAEREEATKLLRAWQMVVSTAAARHGYEVDNVGDIARLMRLPGTHNRKLPDNPRPVTILEAHPHRYNPLDFEQHIITPPADITTTPTPLPTEPRGGVKLPDEELIALALRAKNGANFRRLWEGDTTGYASHSEADLALCGHLAFWTAGDVARIERLFSQSGLVRDKWRDRQDYRDRTVERAIAGCTEVYGGHALEQADTLGALEALVTTVEAQDVPDPTPVWEAVPMLARLPRAALGEATTRLKKALGANINLHDLRSAIADARLSDAPEGAIVLGRQLHDVTTDATALLVKHNTPPVLFRRSGEVVRVTTDEQQRPVLESVGVDIIRHRLGLLAPFVRMTEEGARPADPPEVLCRNILAAWELPFPGLQGVVEAPCLRPDGSVLDTAGYDAATTLYYSPATELHMPPVPATPTAAHIANARHLLVDDLLGDFPFADDASQAAAVALMLTPLLRPTLRGNVPICVVDAPQAGTGKTLLASIAACVATGRPAALFSAPRSDEEWAKKLLAQLAEGFTFILVDNCSGPLEAPSLARVITAEFFADRVLGETRTLTVPQRATWAVTGNNIRLHGDLPRRCYWCRLDARCERPWTRTDFQHGDISGWAATHRGELLAALLTLCRAWWAAGQPVPDGMEPLGSFEAWQRAVAGILHIAGIEGFLSNLRQLHDETDDEGAEWGEFLQAWYEHYGDEPVTARVIADAILQHRSPLAEAVPAAALDDRGIVTGTSLAYALRARHGVFHAGGWLVVRATSRRPTRWIVQRPH